MEASMRCPSGVFDIIKSGNVSAALLASRELFRVSPERTGATYLSTACMNAISGALIKITDQQFGHFKFQGISDAEFRNCYQFFNAVRDESPVSLPVLKEHMEGFYPRGLSYIYYPQLLSTEEPHESSDLLHTVWGSGLGAYYQDTGEIFGPMKVPYRDPLTVGEFSVYRLRMGHGTVSDIMHIETLALLKEALGLQSRLLSFGVGDEEINVFCNLATFGSMDDLAEFCREASERLS